MEDKKILIVGTGRSGSGYVSKLLTLNGIACDHEGSFTPDIHGPIQGRADSSWLAVPYLNDYVNNTKIFHVVRHPIKVVESYTTRQMFFPREWKDIYYEFVVKNLPEVSNIKSPVHAVIYYIVNWSKMIDKVIGNEYYQLEKDLPLILSNLRITTPKDYPNKQYNTNPSNYDKFTLDLDAIDDKYLQMLTIHAEKYGYKI